MGFEYSRDFCAREADGVFQMTVTKARLAEKNDLISPSPVIMRCYSTLLRYAKKKPIFMRCRKSRSFV